MGQEGDVGSYPPQDRPVVVVKWVVVGAWGVVGWSIGQIGSLVW